MATINGTNSDDFLHGTSGDDTLNGFNGNDWMYGHEGNDIFYGGAGVDNFDGGTGDDIYYIENTGDETIYEFLNGGNDKAYVSFSNFTLPANVEWLILTYTAASGFVFGNSLNNSMEGNDFANDFYGMDGNDWINGFGGNDFLTGGNGRDVLYGGSGADIFDYNWVSESPADTNRDIINDFNRLQGDKINVSGIDADLTQPGDQAFTQGTYSSGILTGDVIGGADIQIQLTGAPALDLAVDIIL
jgi:Ca2+-binding RTX toxin-like protein